MARETAMDDLSWRRWQEFADRMARTCYADHKDPDLDFILGEADDFFGGCTKWEIAAFASWDNSDPYPRESGYFDRNRRCRCWWRHGGPRPSRNGQDPDCKICGGDPDWLPMKTGPYPCDMVAEMEGESLPFWECGSCRCHDVGSVGRFYAARDAGLSDDQANRYAKWRTAEVPWWPCSCDEDRYSAEETWIDQWFGPVRCCLRAGIDFANDAHGGGVIGFTAGDVRKMWPDGVPEWVFGPEQRLFKGPLSGLLVENGTFAPLPDDAAVVL